MWHKISIGLIGFIICTLNQSIASPDIQHNCGSLANNYGPFDYQNSSHRREKLPIVEQYHFISKVQKRQGGQTSATPGPDLDYVLRAFPNHVPALYLMTRYQIQLKNAKKPREKGVRTIECYFDRALRLKVNDGSVYLIKGYYLHQAGQLRKSLTAYLKAQELLSDDNLDLTYNLGLLYFDLKQYDMALAQAKKAASLGHPLPGLKMKLKAAKAWK